MTSGDPQKRQDISPELATGGVMVVVSALARDTVTLLVLDRLATPARGGACAGSTVHVVGMAALATSDWHVDS